MKHRPSLLLLAATAQHVVLLSQKGMLSAGAVVQSMGEFNDSWLVLKQGAGAMQKLPDTPEKVAADHEQKFNDAKMQHNANINNDSIKNYITTNLPVMTRARDDLHRLQEDVGELLLAPNAKKVINPVDKAIKALTDAIRMARAHLPETPGAGFSDVDGDALNRSAQQMGREDGLNFPSAGDTTHTQHTSRSTFAPETFG